MHINELEQNLLLVVQHKPFQRFSIISSNNKKNSLSIFSICPFALFTFYGSIVEHTSHSAEIILNKM